jgi:hypothetical protein
MTVTFRVTGPARVRSIELDLIGDGRVGMRLDFPAERDGRDVGTIGYRPLVAGTFDLYIYATDDRGCTAQTGVRRTVHIVP